jgi:hypothetical protein
MDRALGSASDPVDRKCQFFFPALHRAHASIQIGGDLLPGIQTSEVASIAGIRHRRTAIMVILVNQRCKTMWDSVMAVVAHCLNGRAVHRPSLFSRRLRPCQCSFRPGFRRFGHFFLLRDQFTLASNDLCKRSIHYCGNAVLSVGGRRALVLALGCSALVGDRFFASHRSASMRSSISSGRHTGIHGALTHRACTPR